MKELNGSEHFYTNRKKSINVILLKLHSLVIVIEKVGK